MISQNRCQPNVQQTRTPVLKVVQETTEPTADPTNQEATLKPRDTPIHRS